MERTPVMHLKIPPNESDINKPVVRRNSQKCGIVFFGSRASHSLKLHTNIVWPQRGFILTVKPLIVDFGV